MIRLPFRARAVGAAATAAVLALAACTEPDGVGPVPIQLALAITGGAAGETIVAAPYYLRSNSEVPFPEVTKVLGAGPTDQVELGLDVAECIADPEREAGDGCPVRIRLSLLSAQGDVVDRHQIGPFVVRPGSVVTTPPVVLRAPGSLVLSGLPDTMNVGQNAAGSAEVRDRQGAVIGGLEIRWRSSAPANVSVSATGTATALQAGTATLSAAVAADSSIAASRPIVVRGVVSVAIAPDSLTLDPGANATPGATVTVIGVANDVRWLSRNPVIASVDGTGRITAAAAGRTVVVAEALADPTRRDSVVVTVRGVLSVTVAPPSASIDPGATVTATATVLATGAVPTTVSWTSRDVEVATVSAAGVITGVSPGIVPIVATATADPTKADSAMVSVRGVIDVDVTQDTLRLNPGQTFTPGVTVTTAGGTSQGVTWEISNPAVATVNPVTGLVTGIAPGIAFVTARSVADPTKSDGAFVRVAGILSVTYVQDSLWLDIPSVETPTAVVVAVDVPATMTFTSSNPGVATVNGAGQVTAIAGGRTVIRATAVADPSRRDSVVVNVSSRWTTALRTVGSAAAGGALLTTAGLNQTGSAWTYGKRHLAGGFIAQFGFRITNRGGALDSFGQSGGEGLAFVIQNQDSVALGDGGSGMGYASITRSLAIEFDMFANPGTGDPNGNHISIQTRGLQGNSASHTFSLAVASVPQDMSLGLSQDVTITYVSGLLEVQIESFFAITLAIDLTNIGGVNLLDPQGRAWIGFTSATGAAFQDHIIQFIDLP